MFEMFQLSPQQLQSQMEIFLRLKLMEGLFILALSILWLELMLPWTHQV